MASDAGEYVKSLLADAEIAAQITCHRLLPGTLAEYAENHIPWSAAIARLLNQRNIRLYSHQALATDHIRAGHSIVAATPTASGKSLVYNLPIIEKYLLDPESRALYLFPLKALAQDQLQAFNSLCQHWPEEGRPHAALYDGDTCEHDRRQIRQNPPCALFTNPEMLHLAILPHHELWTSFLASLTHIVVDEAHVYRGVFGSHMAQVFRRLNRIINRYGAKPTYIFCTATLGNPVELASSLMDAGEDTPVLINKSGAPQGARHFLFINPIQAASTCAIDLLKRGLEKKLRVIVYCRSRRMTELIGIWAGEAGFKDQISSYRAGYLPSERRDIEERMASGELRAVVSTSALELGIDIGGLDVCILVGYPGSVIQTLQRGGRVGRARQDSAVLLVAGEDALDQYFANNPEDFFNRLPEKAVINPDNETILTRHLECAAAETPLIAGERWLENPAAQKAVASLENSGLLACASSGREWVATAKMPQKNLELRGCGQNYTLEDETGRLIGDMDGFRAWREGHPGAVYIHHGRTYVVDSIDSGKMRIMAKSANVDWFTRVRGNKSTDILEEKERAVMGRTVIFSGRLRVSEFISGYEKRSNAGQRLLSITPLDAPPHVFETDGAWLVIPDSIRADMESKFIHFMGSIHALEHAMIGLLPLEVLADRNDFGGISIPMHHQLGLPAIFVYDAAPGGAGLVSGAFSRMEDLLRATLANLQACKCENGCPSCIQSPKCGSGNRPLSKAGAIFLLKEILGQSEERGEKGTGPGGHEEGRAIYENLIISPAPDRLMPVGRTPEKSAKTVSPPPAGLSSRADAFLRRLEGENQKIPVLGEEAPGHLPQDHPDHYVVFDVETRLSAKEVGGWRNAGRMGVSVAVLYDSVADDFFTYEQDELGEMFSRMAKASLVIGFNSWSFDYEVLAPFAEIMAPPFPKPFSLRKLPTLDLLRRVFAATHTRISLDNLSRATLGAPKSASGLLALKWWKEGKLAEIAAYCRKDVELTRDLYLYGLSQGNVFYTNKAGIKVNVPVDFTILLDISRKG